MVRLVALATAVFFAGAHADVEFHRTIDSLSGASGSLTIDGQACSSSDEHGSNDCDLHWGSKYSVHVNGSLAKDVMTGTKISVDAKVDGFIGWKFDCEACGASCEITVPVVHKKYTYQMPPCPIKAGALQKTLSAALPSKAPVPLKVSVEGTVSVTAADGSTLAHVTVKGSASPSATSTAPRLWTAWQLFKTKFGRGKTYEPDIGNPNHAAAFVEDLMR